MSVYYPIMWIPCHYFTNWIYFTVLNHSSTFVHSDYFQIFIMISNIVVNIYTTHIFYPVYIPRGLIGRWKDFHSFKTFAKHCWFLLLFFAAQGSKSPEDLDNK